MSENLENLVREPTKTAAVHGGLEGICVSEGNPGFQGMQIHDPGEATEREHEREREHVVMTFRRSGGNRFGSEFTRSQTLNRTSCPVQPIG
jgi:hypothetical protein